MATNKNSNPKVISSSDARIEGQLQLEDSLVVDPRPGGTGNPVVLTATDNGLYVNDSELLASSEVLDEEGNINANLLPSVSLVSVQTAASEAAMLALEAQEGDVVVRTDLDEAYMHNSGTAGDMNDWTQISFVPVVSVAGKVGSVTLEKADISDLDETDYAAASHTHTKADISDLDESDYAAASHTHTKADISDLDESDYAAASHTHVAADVTDLNARQTLTQTVVVSADSEVEVSLPLATAFGMWKLSTNKAARVRLYSSAADRTADAARAEGAAPAEGVGLITEVITTAELLAVPLAPPQFGASLEATPSSNISALVKNKGATGDVTLTIIWTPFG